MASSVNGNGKQHWPPDWRSVAHAALGRLPAQFLVLAILLGGLAWFVHSENRHREQVYAPLLAACLNVMQERH
jgi:hypothetical protein